MCDPALRNSAFAPAAPLARPLRVTPVGRRRTVNTAHFLGSRVAAILPEAELRAITVGVS